jgi:hypothetical protein
MKTIPDGRILVNHSRIMTGDRGRNRGLRRREMAMGSMRLMRKLENEVAVDLKVMAFLPLAC